jgi:hypothetical protein
MGKQWYTTVGVPGGEFAVRATSHSCAVEELAKSVPDELLTEEVSLICTTCRADIPPRRDLKIVRPASPELVDWLENKPPDSVYGYFRMPGGWLRCDDNTAVHIPVAGAAGITVIEGDTHA